MKKERILSLIAVILISIYIINIIGGAWGENTSTTNTNSTNGSSINFDTNKAKTLIANTYNSIKSKIAKVLGFKSLFGYLKIFSISFFIGCTAGMTIFFLGFIERKLFRLAWFYDHFTSGGGIIQNNFFAQNFLSFFILGVAYSLLKTLPLISSIINIINLNVILRIGENKQGFFMWWFNNSMETCILVFIVGFIPGIISYLIKRRKEEKVELGRARLRAAMQGMRVIGDQMQN